MASTMAAPTNLGFRLAVMSASLTLKGVPTAAHLACSIQKGSLMAVHWAGMMAVKLASQKLRGAQTAAH